MKTKRQIHREIKIARESFAGMGDKKVLKRHPNVSKEDLDAWKEAHVEFITDPDARPDDLTEYIKECQGLTGPEPTAGASDVLDELGARLSTLERGISALTETVAGIQKKSSGSSSTRR